MAGNGRQEGESKQQPAGAVDESLKSRVDKLCEDIDNAADSNVADREDLDEICKVLKRISGRMPIKRKDDGTAPKQEKEEEKEKEKEKEQELLPQSKMEELEKLLPAIKRAFDRRKSPSSPAPKEEQAADKKTLLPSSCYPFKARASPPSEQQQTKQKEEEEDDGVTLKLLLRLAENVLEPEQYYEWTTSYVDESRIYGWDKDADELADALVAPDDGDEKGMLFRAAGIAGVHGSGKTALAQKVFVHDKAKDNFALRLWVCVGPPDSEDRFDLLYRMLDNLGLDTNKVEAIVDNSNVVKAAINKILNDPARVEAIKKKAADDMKKKPSEGEKDEQSIFEQLVKEEPEVVKSKIGVLLYILHMTLSKTSYMIVFDDIRAYGDDGWYSNLAQLPPPDGEWGDRLAYGLPKGNQHRGAVLVTCRNEEHARSMVRTGRVVRPPKLEGDDAWKLFEREYQQQKEAIRRKKQQKDGGDEGGKAADGGEDMLLKELREMKDQIVGKCLGLPVAIAEAAKGFAGLEPLPDEEDDAKTAPAAKNQTPAAADDAGSKSNKDVQAADNSAATS